MKAPRVEYIELLGKKYPMCFTPAVAEELEEEFGSLNNIGEGLANDGKQMKALNTMVETLMEAGQNYAKIIGLECPEPLPCRAADVIDMTDPDTVAELIQLVSRTISAGSSRQVEAKVKNPEATPDE